MNVDLDQTRAWIHLIIELSPTIRRAGITSLGFGGQTATFAAAEPEIAETKSGVDPEMVENIPMNPFEDPASYPMGSVPYFDYDDLPTNRDGY